MRISLLLPIVVSSLFALSTVLAAQEPVTSAADVESLFHSSDPKLDANKQVVFHIERDLLETGHWELASKYLTERYIQHNPNAASGREGVVKYFSKVVPKPIPARMATRVVSVTAEGDLVTVATVRELKDPKDPTRTYTTTWFDMWRMMDGKADEHWDCAARP